MKPIAAIVAAALAWLACATAGNLALRFGWPGYAGAEASWLFTAPMLLARLALGAASTALGGFVAAAIAKSGLRIAGALAVLLLVAFVPQHAVLWPRFPLWYHALFLLSLPICTVIGAMLFAASNFRRETIS